MASTVATLFFARAGQRPEDVALATASDELTYAQLARRSRQLAAHMAGAGVARGSRVAVLSENRAEFVEVVLAAACLGAVVACQNWRLAPRELSDCVRLAAPSLAFVSPRFSDCRQALNLPDRLVVEFGSRYEASLAEGASVDPSEAVDPEDALLLLYTSGTTGQPKGALISHRAEIVRNLVTRAEFGVATADSFVAWSPLYHMGAMDNSLGTLMSGGKVILVDGFDAERLASIVETERLGWLLLMPGMVGHFAQLLKQRGSRPRGVTVCGVMADLVPRHEIAEITSLLSAPYANTFGSTETGCPPCSSSLIPEGMVPERLSKQQSPFCEVKLVDAQGREVPRGTPGELCMRGPTLFSGYYAADAVNQEDFRGGWFHMGDVFIRNPDGSLDFVARVKYMIKTGGENVYPAEIENVLLSHPGVVEAAVVRRSDDRWGEVPVAFVARDDQSLGEDELSLLCRERLAGYKQPKGFVFLPLSEFPRSASGKVQRHELEKKLAEA